MMALKRLSSTDIRIKDFNLMASIVLNHIQKSYKLEMKNKKNLGHGPEIRCARG